MTEDIKVLANGRLLVARQQAVARITFNKPERMNAMSLDMWQGLTETLDELREDDRIRVVVLCGAGDKAFVSGADISEFESQRSSEDTVRNYNRIASAADQALYDFPKPTIAEIKGYCIGGGMGLAIGCDIRICADDARLGITAGKLGLGYGYDGVRKLVSLAGPEVASQILYSARLFPADAAQRMGLVSEVVPRKDLASTVTDLASRIASNAPKTVRAAKAAIRAVLMPEGPVDRAMVDRLVADCFASEDYAEGYRAFDEKRKPQFRDPLKRAEGYRRNAHNAQHRRAEHLDRPDRDCGGRDRARSGAAAAGHARPQSDICNRRRPAAILALSLLQSRSYGIATEGGWPRTTGAFPATGGTAAPNVGQWPG